MNCYRSIRSMASFRISPLDQKTRALHFPNPVYVCKPLDQMNHSRIPPASSLFLSGSPPIVTPSFGSRVSALTLRLPQSQALHFCEKHQGSEPFGKIPTVYNCHSVGKWRRLYHRIPLAKGYVDTRPVSLISSWWTKGRVCERPPYSSTSSELPAYKILDSGMILLKNYISLKDQVDIVNICQKWGMGPGGFYKPAELQSYMMCFGRNWDPKTGYDKPYRSDGSVPPQLPHELISLAEAAVQDAQTHLNELPSVCPDSCLVNFYPTNGRWELHQDRDESSDSLRRGLPVVSFSIGEMAEFVYRPAGDKQKLKSLLLRSGDVLIFGGKSRLIYHGVTQIAEYTTPRPLFDETGYRAGHLSLTLKKF